MTTQPEPDLLTIGRVVELLQQEFPDITVSSLRFLEREGLVTPQRKPGGHRLYHGVDIERVRRIKRWQAERIPLKEIGRRLESAPTADDIDAVVESMTARLFQEDIPGALDILWNVQRSGTPMLSICNDILTPVLRNLGDDQGNHLIPVDVQMELDEQLISFFSKITRNPGHLPGMPVIVAACPPWERHDMPLRMLVALLTENGASVHFIGAQVDATFVNDAIVRLQPNFVLISLTVQPPESASVWMEDVTVSMTGDQTLYVGGIGSEFLRKYEAQNVKILGTGSYEAVLERLLPSRG